METMRRISKRYYLRQAVACVLSCWMLLGMPTRTAFANPNPASNTVPIPGNVLDTTTPLDWTGSSGLDAVIGTATGNNVITWNNLDIGRDASATFTQDGGWILNNIQDSSATGIFGGLNGQNCGLIVMNPLGVVFGPRALVSAKSFMALGLSMDTAEFISQGDLFDPLNFNYGTEGESGGDIELQYKSGHRAEIHVNETLALIGKNITNKGKIYAEKPGAYVVMAAGDTVTIGRENSHVNVQVTPSEDNKNWVKNEGYLDTDNEGVNGKVSLVLAAGDIYSTAIKDVESLRATALNTADFDSIDVEATSGSPAVAEVVITTGNSLEIEHDITATATGDGEYDATASISLTSEHGNVDIGNHHNTEVTATAKDGANNTATVSISAPEGDVSIVADNEDVEVLAEAYGDYYPAVSNNANVDITAGGDVHVKSEGGSYGYCGFEPYVASVEAIAENAGSSNDAGVDITAGGDVVVLSEDGGEARVEAYAGNCYSSHNTATVNLTAEDGYVLVHAIGGHYDCRWDEFTPSEAAVRATAESAGVGEGDDISTNDATITIIARDIVEPVDTDGDSDLDVITSDTDGDSDKDGDVMVVGVMGGKAEVEAIAKDGGANSAGVSIDADSDVEVIALCEGQPSQAEIMALAKDADVSNTALVDITAGGDVLVLAENGGKAEIESIAKDGPTNQADVDIDAGGEVIVKAEGGLIDKEWVTIVDSYNVHIKHEVVTPATWDIHVKKSGCSYPSCYGVINNSTEYSPDLAAHGYDPADGWYIQYRDDYHSGSSTWEDTTIIASSKTPDLAAIGYAGWEYANDYHHPEHDPEPYWSENTHDELHTSFEAPSVASIKAIAEDDLQSNTANILINAGDDVKVMAFDGGVAEMIAETEDGELNTSDITINSNGDVKVLAIGNTETTDSPKATSEALVKASAKEGEENTATIGINAVGGDVLVLGKEGSEAAITALAEKARSPETNTAKVNITATKVDVTEMVLVSGGDTPDDETDDVYQEVVVCTKGGDVKVIGVKGGEAEIEALAMKGATNNADVLICIDGGVKVKAEKGGEAEIEALAMKGNTNTATVGIGARGEEGVQVIAEQGGEAGISSKAEKGETNTASTIVCTGGDVKVIAKEGGDAEILAQTKDGKFNDSYTGIGAMGDVLVLGKEGGDAQIRAEAEVDFENCIKNEEQIATTADAETVVFSHEGDVKVLAFHNGYSGITAEAQGAHLNDAKVGVAAAADLSPVLVIPEKGDPYYSTGNVTVKAYCNSEAEILAWAHDADPMYELPAPPTGLIITDVLLAEPTIIPGENTAKTVICAPGEVRVEADKGSEARIKSRAGWFGDGEAINTATTKVYGSEVKVDVSSLYHGQGIWAYAVGADENPHTPSHYCMTDTENGGVIGITDGQTTLIIDTYANRTDCPDCPPCPCEQAAAVLTVAAPLALPVQPRIEGCPLLVQGAAQELSGVAEPETINVLMENSLALNPGINPCEACAALLDSAAILADVDGSRMAALAAVVGSVAAPDQPFDPAAEMMIASAIAENADNAENPQYVFAGEFVDALVNYVAAAADLGIPAEDSKALVMAKYGAALDAPENANVKAYVEARLAAM